MTTYDVTQSPPSASRPSDDRSIGELIGDLTRETTQLVRQEINLAKTEMSVKAAKVGKDIGLIAAGGVLAFTGVLALVAFLILALIRLGLAPLAVRTDRGCSACRHRRGTGYEWSEEA